MAKECFGQFLVDKGVISSEVLLHSLEEHISKEMPVGLLALEKGIMTLDQFIYVQHERTKTGKQFWVTAIEAGHLTKPQIQGLFFDQQEALKSLEGTLVKRGHLTGERLESLRKEFSGGPSTPNVSPQPEAPGLTRNEMVRIILDETVSVYARAVHGTLKVKSIHTKPINLPVAEYIFAVNVEGSAPFIYTLGLPLSTIIQIGVAMGAQAQSDFSSIMLDSACEVVSMIVGNACAKLRKKASNLRMGIPFIYRTAHDKKLPSDAVHVVMASPKGDFPLSIFFPRTAT